MKVPLVEKKKVTIRNQNSPVEDKRAVSANLGEILGKTLFFFESYDSCPLSYLPEFFRKRTREIARKWPTQPPTWLSPRATTKPR